VKARSASTAAELDAVDPLAALRDEFELPEGIYLVGNSLGALPRAARDYVNVEFDRWSTLGVEGHFTGRLGWKDYHELLTEQLARLAGARADEVVAMNALTVNLHLLLISFYRPTSRRHKILIEDHAFPSDHFTVESQIRQRGFDPATSLVTVTPREGEETLRPADLLAAIAEHGDELATILLPYSVVLNQHGTAAGLVLLAIAAVDARRSATAGLLLALAATIDMTAMFPALAMCWPVIANGGLKGLLRYVGGAILPLAVHCAVNLHVAGDLVPFSLHREAFEYPMSPFLLSSLTGVDQPLLSLERAVYVWGSTFGASGLFSHHPILLAAIVCGCLLPFVRRADASADGLSRGVLGATALGSAGIAAFYLTSSNNASNVDATSGYEGDRTVFYSCFTDRRT